MGDGKVTSHIVFIIFVVLWFMNENMRKPV